jgi:outer membrane usher protein
MAAGIALVVWAGLAAPRAHAQTQPPDRTVWAFTLNDVPKGDVVIAIRSDGPWVDPESLLAAGLTSLPPGRREPLFGASSPQWVSLASLAPRVRFVLDETTITLRVTADPNLLGTSEFDLTNPRPAGWVVRSNASTFLNYGVQWSQDAGSFGSFEIGARLFGQLFSSAATVDDQGRVTPGLSQWTVDQVGHRRRWIVGDTLGRATTMGSAPIVGGFSVSTELGLDPYYIAYPSPTIVGAVQTPSTADVYIDGRLASHIRLPPGRYALSDLPVESGLGQVQVIIRDAFGRQQQFNVGFYLTPDLLKRGEQDYAYLAGWERTVDGTTVTYGRPVATALHRVGLSDSVSVGVQAEGAEDVAVAGLGVQVQAWRLGLVAFEALGARLGDLEPGYAATGLYSFLGGPVGLDARVTWVGPRFGNLYFIPALREQLFVDATSSLSLGPLGSVSLGWSRGSPDSFRSRIAPLLPSASGQLNLPSRTLLRDEDLEPQVRTVRVGYSLNLTSRVQLTLSASRSKRLGELKPWLGFGSVNVLLGRRVVASTVTNVDENGDALTSVHLQRSLPLGPGFGFRIDADAQEPYRSAAVAQVQHRFGAIGARVDAAKGEETAATFGVAGSLVAIGGRLMLTRVVNDAFALVRVPETSGVRVLANNTLIGRTGRSGTLFVPDLRSYLSNPIGIRQEDLPVEVRLGAIEQTIAPPYRGGAVVSFEAQTIRTLVGRLDTGGEVPAYGTLVVESLDGLSSPLNATGEFYFEDLPPGDHAAVATWNNRSCRAVLRMPPGEASINDAGVVRCVPDP